MCYTNYNEWVQYIEDKYSQRTKKISSGFRAWFESISVKPILQSELRRIKNLKFKGASTDVGEDLILTAWAQAFYPDYYDEKQDIVIKRLDGKDTFFGVTRGNGKNLRGYWKGDHDLPIDIPFIQNKKIVKKKNNNYSWIEICSALQKKYGIFETIDDLNQFVFMVGYRANNDVKNETNNIEFCNYGFYLRNLDQLCLAYSILHGYSINEYEHLVCRCNDLAVEFDSNPQMTATGAVLQRNFKDFLVTPFNCDEDEFVNQVKSSSAYILLDKGLHATTIKKIYNISYNIFEQYMSMRGGSDRELIRLEAKEDGFFTGYITEIGFMISQILHELGIKKEYGKTLDGLRKEISDIIKIEYITDLNGEIERQCGDRYFESKMGREIFIERFIVNLRYLLIMLCLKQFNDSGKMTNALKVVQSANKVLNRYGFRMIEIDVSGDNSINVDMRDIFDWFVVQAIIYEERMTTTLNGNQIHNVSGYRTLLKYIFNTELKTETESMFYVK